MLLSVTEKGKLKKPMKNNLSIIKVTVFLLHDSKNNFQILSNGQQSYYSKDNIMKK